MPHAGRGDVRDALHGDAFPLFDRKRVIGRFQLDERTHAAVAQVDTCLERERVGIARKRIAKPAKKRIDVISLLGLPEFVNERKALFGERDPDAQTNGSLRPTIGTSRQPRTKKC